MRKKALHQMLISAIGLRSSRAVVVFAFTLALPVIAMTVAAKAQTYTVLYSFTGGIDGANPEAGLIRDSLGNLYGTTQDGGDMTLCSGFGCGVVFKLDKDNGESVLHTFKEAAGGENPEAGLIRDPAGNLYGTTFFGGHMAACGGAGCGVVFKLDKTGKVRLLHTFTGGADGSHPQADLILDEEGNLYGTTFQGGKETPPCDRDGCGVVFKLDKNGKETVLHSFRGNDGWSPHAGVIRDTAGNFYGTTILGGDLGCFSGGCGTVFKLHRNGKLTVLHSFVGPPTDGDSPTAGVIRDAAGNLYGVAETGGTSNNGTVFEVDRTGKYRTLYDFAGGVDGYTPYGGLVQDAAGNLYGTTCCGGTHNNGTVYKLDKTGKKTVLHNFTGGKDGAGPFAGLIRDAAGNLYGTTAGGGNSIYGVVFKLTP